MKRLIFLIIVFVSFNSYAADFAKPHNGGFLFKSAGDPVKESKMRMRGYLPLVDAEQPIYDPDTHYIVKQYTIGDTEITREWVVYERTEADKKRIADAKLKAADILANLPTWAQVETAIDNIASLAEAKVFIKKLARVVYWNTKGTSE